MKNRYFYAVQHLFNQHIQKNLPFLVGKKLLLAISGGLDSVVLARLCHAIKLNIGLAHCNFNLRGNESDQDENFVIDLADHLDLEVFVQQFYTEAYAHDHQLSIQMAARTLRYEWFADLSRDLSFDFILTAHHADDNLETFLINLSRGSGLEGLTGIPSINGNVVRPLLPFSRDSIEDFAKGEGFQWREDSSNASTKYLRNALRHQVIPELKKLNPQFLQNFQDSVSHLAEARFLVDQHMDSKVDELTDKKNESEWLLNCERLLAMENPKAYLYELLKEFGFTEWNDVLALLTAQSGKSVYSTTHQLLKNREHLVLSKTSDKTKTSYRIDALDKNVQLSDFQINFEKSENRNENSSTRIYVDLDLIKLPLLVRKWQEGDVFYPIGMKGKKKLSKYFKDEKLSLHEKQQIWLLCSDEKIVWVMGHRADDRFKVSGSTEAILKIELIPVNQP